MLVSKSWVLELKIFTLSGQHEIFGASFLGV